MTTHLIAQTGPLQGLILNLDEETQEWILGKSPDTADLVIDDEALAQRHAKLYRTTEGIFLENLSHINPILVNDEETNNPTLLKEGDLLLIGDTTFLLSEVATIPAPDSNYGKDDLSQNDTIFEDLSSDNELHFSLPPPTPFLLKVISGPNAGAEIGIQKGHSYTLGKDAHTCDVLFQDLSVSRTHARLKVSDDGILEIEDLGSKNGIAINGSPVTHSQTFTSKDLVALGTTIFIIIDREAPQDTIYSPMALQEESEESASSTPIPDKQETSWKKEIIPTKYLALLGGAAAIFIVAFLSFFSLFKSKSVEIAHKEPVSKIEEALHAEKFSMVTFSFNPAAGKLFLAGHVLSTIDYQEMRFALSQIPFLTGIEDVVVIDEGIAKEMNDILSANAGWQGVSIRVPKPGKFIAIGYLQTNEELNQVSEYLTVNFPYLDKLDNQIASEETLQTEVANLLLTGGFSAVSYELNLGNLLLAGLYDHKKESSYKHLVKQFQKMPGITTVKNLASPVHSKHVAINLSSDYHISGISLHDNKGFNAVVNGKIYTLGDFVSGMRITDIESNTILLEKDGIKYKIDYMLK